MNRYVKRKRLDPLASYVPALLLAREQLEASGAAFRARDAAAARSLLRSGAFGGVRESVRAVGEYATEAGQPGGELATAFFRELEVFDRSMRPAERRQKEQLEAAAAEDARGGGGGGSSGGSSSSGQDDDDPDGKIAEAEKATLAALDALVATVPGETVERAKQVVASALEGLEQAEEEGRGRGGGASAGRAGGGGAIGGGNSSADPALLEGLLAKE
jgi:hypothetical protein